MKYYPSATPTILDFYVVDFGDLWIFGFGDLGIWGFWGLGIWGFCDLGLLELFQCVSFEMLIVDDL